MNRPEARTEEGFTLIELLIAGVISSLILASVGMVFILGLRSTKGTTQKLAESHDAQLLSTFLPADLAGVTPSGVTTTAAVATGCSGVVTPPEDGVRSRNWVKVESAVTQTNGTVQFLEASYRTRLFNAEWQLVRHACQQGQPATLTVVAHNLNDLTQAGATMPL